MASLTAGTAKMGGALLSPAIAASVMVAGNDVWIKAGTYSITSTSSNVANGVINSAVAGVDYTNGTHWEGYQTTRGDKGTRPVLQLQASLTASAITIAVLNGATCFVDNIIFDCNTGNSNANGITSTSASIRFVRLKAMGAAGTGYGISQTSVTSLMTRCEASGCSGVAGIRIGGKAAFCESHGNTTIGFTTGVNGGTFVRCNSYANSGASSDGFGNTPANNATYINCNSYSNGRYGFDFTGVTTIHLIVNCIAYGNTSAQFKEDGVKDGVLGFNNAGTLSTSANFPNVTGQITLSADPFTNGGSGDFSLNTTAGGGAACRAAGYPGVMPAGTSTGYLDVGAIQHADPAASGGGLLVNSGMTGGIRG